MLRIVCLAISTTALCMVLGVTSADGAQGDCRDVAHGSGCEVTCPCCNHVCKLSSKMEKETKHCWDVICEPICIPKVRFPWEKICQPKCAKIKYVNVLKKHEYECERCKYTWTPVCADCGCNGTGNCGCASGDGCAGGICDDAGCDAAVQPARPTQEGGKQAIYTPMPVPNSAAARALKDAGPSSQLKPIAKRTLSDD